jgi:hypothetical protein
MGQLKPRNIARLEQTTQSRMSNRKLNVRIAVAVLVAIGLTGCTGNDRPKTIPITGRVTIDGQPPGERGRLHFAPVTAADGYSKRPAGGAFGVDGVYRVKSWKPDDGLVPGHYKVSFKPGNPNTTKILRKYQDAGTSGLEVNVTADQDQIQFDIPLLSK